MTVKKEKRLSKLAREFNLGISTIVDFLKKKGFEVDSNPNTKVSAECYKALLKEYSSQISVKKESEKLNLNKNRNKKETLSVEDMVPDNKKNEEKTSEDVVIIKDNSGKKTHAKETSSKKEEKKEEKKVETKEEKKDLNLNVNVVGKINLENLNPKTRPDKKEKKGTEKIKEKPHEPKVAKEILEKKTKTNPKENKKEEKATIKDEKEKVLEKKEKKSQVVEQKEKLTKKTVETTPKAKTVEEKKLVVKEKKEKTDKKETAESNKKEDEENDKVYKTGTKIETDIKVIGRIDLDSLNQKTRPPKKTRKQKEEERRKKERARVQDVQRRKQEQIKKIEAKIKNPDTLTKEELEHYKTEVKKLSGPTVVGRIDLPDDKNKRKNASTGGSDKRNKKKRRKRITKDPVSVKDEVKSGGGKKDKANDDPRERKKAQRTNRKNKKIQKKEVSEEDVQKQIKETLQRLTSSKQKSKGAKHRRLKREYIREKKLEEVEQREKEKNILKVTEFVTVSELASMMDVPATDVISTCMTLGLFVGINQRLDAETISLVSEEFGYEIEFVSVELQEAILEEEDKEEDLQARPPIVTVMGHVDHGKTSLLDYIRNTNVIGGEAGGITQHIGAYRVSLEGGKVITFLDTPGHKAFTAMRARGAQVTDVVIIVVAADDSVMPQTVEAINHAQAAGVPIIFAINKIDKPNAIPEKIKEELAKMNFLVEEWGGKYQSQDISAKKGLYIDELLEKVLLEAEMLELKGNPTKRAVGTVIESTLDKGRGYVATLLVQSGKMEVGDFILAGCATGRIKAMYNERNQRIEKAGPSEPVLILGLDGAPQAGDKFHVMPDEREAKDLANKRLQLQREQGLRAQKHITLDEIGRRIAIGNFKELNVIVKGDVIGTVEALSDSLIKLSTEQIQVNVIHKAVGQIVESDIMLATASNAIVIGFQVRPSIGARKLAETEGIDIRLYSIIYDAINEIKDAMEGMLSPEIKEEIKGTAEILEIFKITKVGTIAGCIVRDGKITRTAKVRVIREGIVIYSGELGSLKRFKDDVKEVKSGFECGLNIERFNDIKVGDLVEAYEETEVKRRLQ
ncbi:MAG: translation initiation factor IF-2 [Bacteroidia bacterium]|nr:MAG: translation initiation factor IF-2 [Bacteroidia bacterium]